MSAVLCIGILRAGGKCTQRNGSRKDDGAPVALLPYGLTGYRFLDSKTGKWIKLNNKTAQLIDVEAICFYKPLPLKKIGVKDLLFYIVQCMSTADFALIGIATLAVSLLGLLTPKIQRLIYGPVIESTSTQLLFAVFGFLICLSLSQIFIGVTKQLIMSRLGSKMNIQVQAAGMMRLLSLPASFFKEYASGDLSTRMGYINSLCTKAVRTEIIKNSNNIAVVQVSVLSP